MKRLAPLKDENEFLEFNCLECLLNRIRPCKKVVKLSKNLNMNGSFDTQLAISFKWQGFDGKKLDSKSKGPMTKP